MAKPQRPQHLGRPIGRRAAVAGVGAAGVIASVARPVPARADRPSERATATPTPRQERTLRAHALERLGGELLEALRACEHAGVRLVEAFAVRHGGLPFVVEVQAASGHREIGARRTFELLRRDTAGDTPIATVGQLALVMQNRGDGRTASPEDDARLALRIGAALERHASLLETLPLLTARERRRSAPFATLHVPHDPYDPRDRHDPSRGR
ncbi:MAG: hypothetical protein K1X94_35470 [Sandaracinaceae bacterium]|nr:hypothetical protein [Sandaracinaceae bacterium]